MAKQRHRARISTTHAVPVYGGMRFTRDDMEQLAAAVQSGAMPMHLNHDIRRPVAAEILATGGGTAPGW
ncbi:MAG: hypothetical protein JWO62_2537 [Acidimicrobiaceae bacterium]|nr:hypothetical protein [Acidimicrobiaceae bacterium]